MKRLLSFVMAVVMIICALPMTVIAEEIEESGLFSTVEIIASGYCGGEGDGTNLSWNITKNDSGYYTVTITGTGRMADYKSIHYDTVTYVEYTAPWWDGWHYSINEVVIDNGITYIGSLAFSGLEKLKKVTIGDYVAEIGEYAFSWSQTGNLIEEVVLPDSVIKIGTGAFRNCQKLKRVKMSQNIQTIGQSCFVNCVKLVDINLPASLQKIETGLFDSCHSLESVIIPDSVKEIGEYAFKDCYSLYTVSISKSVEKIGNGVFSGCRSLQSIMVDSMNQHYCSDENGILFSKDMKNLISYPCGNPLQTYIVPDYVEELSSRSFYGAVNLKSIVLSERILYVGDYAFFESNLEKAVANCSEAEWGNWIFYCCKKLKDVRLPNKMAEISKGMFDNCQSLTNVDIPDGVTTIGSWAFDYCINLTSVTIPKSVVSIDSDCNPFRDCKKLVIYGYEKTAAQSFAKSKGIKFVPLDFDLDAYHAQQAILGELGVDPMYSGDTPCEIAVDAVEKSKADDLYNGWTAVTKVVDSLVSDPTIGVKYLTVDKVDMYTAIILEAMQSSCELKAFSTYKKHYKLLSLTESLIYGGLNTIQEYDTNVLLHDNMVNLTPEIKDDIKNLVKERLTEQFGAKKMLNAEYTKTFDKYMNNMLTAASEINDLVETTASFYMLLSLSSEMQDVLKQLYEECPSGNYALKTALFRCYSVVESGFDGFIANATLNGMATVGLNGVTWAVKDAWKCVMDKVKIAYPSVGVLVAVYKTTKNLLR